MDGVTGRCQVHLVFTQVGVYNKRVVKIPETQRENGCSTRRKRHFGSYKCTSAVDGKLFFRIVQYNDGRLTFSELAGFDTHPSMEIHTPSVAHTETLDMSLIGYGSPKPSTPAPQPAPSSDEIKVLVNGTALVFDQAPIIENGRTLVPLRAIFEALGADVHWEQSTQTVTAVRGDMTVTLTIGSSILTRNGDQVTLDVPAKIVNGRTLVPARAVAESFGADVKWDQATNTVTITTVDTSSTAKPMEIMYELSGTFQMAENIESVESMATDVILVFERSMSLHVDGRIMSGISEVIIVTSNWTADDWVEYSRTYAGKKVHIKGLGAFNSTKGMLEVEIGSITLI